MSSINFNSEINKIFGCIKKRTHKLNKDLMQIKLIIFKMKSFDIDTTTKL